MENKKLQKLSMAALIASILPLAAFTGALSGMVIYDRWIRGKMKILLHVVSQYLPYIDYPGSLNATACVNKAAETAE